MGLVGDWPFSEVPESQNTHLKGISFPDSIFDFCGRRLHPGQASDDQSMLPAGRGVLRCYLRPGRSGDRR